MNINRQISNLTWPALLFFTSIMWVINLSAEMESSGIDFKDYKGLWLTKIDNEAIYLLIKKNHVARIIYKDRIDNNVYRGQWKLLKNTLLVSSNNFDDLKFCLKSSDLESAISLKEQKGQTKIQILTKVSDEILGEWARPPNYQAPKDQYMPSTYLGLWETKDLNGPRLINILNNRSVISRVKEVSKSNPKNILQGEWYKHGQQLHIAWEDGSYSIIDNRNENRVKLFHFGPGESINEEAASYELIKKSQSKFDWPKNHLLQTQSKNISLSQFDEKLLSKFYRGEWITINETQPNAVEIMKFNRFGGVNLASDPKIKGSWHLYDKGCLINLEGGIRMRLKYIGSAFLIFVHKANRPLDGYPNKILKTAPLNQKKLDELSNEFYFTLKFLKQVENLFTREGKPPLISNWSDRDIINPSPRSPWWWPIWSDNPKIEESKPFSKNNLSTTLTNDADFIDSNLEANQTNLSYPIYEAKESKWEWPF